MKRKSRGKPVSRVTDVKSRIRKQIEGMTARAQVDVDRKGVWVADKVEQALAKMERSVRR